MPTAVDRPLRVFLCHIMPVGYAKEDTLRALRKPTAPQGDDMRDHYRQLTAAPQGGDKGWMDVWLEEMKLLSSKV